MNRTRDFYDLILQHANTEKEPKALFCSASTEFSRFNDLELDHGPWHACPLSAGPIPSRRSDTINQLIFIHLHTPTGQSPRHQQGWRYEMYGYRRH